MKRNLVSKFLLLLSIFCITILLTQSAYALTNGYALVVGGNMGPEQNYIDTEAYASYAANKYRNMGYATALVQNPTYDILRGHYEGTNIDVLSSDILCLIGSGTNTGVYYNYLGQGGDFHTGVHYGYDTFFNGNQLHTAGLMSHCSSRSVELATFAGSNTASPSLTDDEGNKSNIIKKMTSDHLAKVAIGWKYTIDMDELGIFLEAYHDSLFCNKTIREALDFAAAVKNYPYGCNVEDYGTSILNSTYYNSTIKLNTYSYSNQNMNNEFEYPENYKFITPVAFDVNNLNSITVAFEQINKNINLNDFDVSINNSVDNNYNIKLTQKVNGMLTNSAYYVIVEDGVITTIVDYSKEINNDEILKINNSINTLNNQEKINSKITEFKSNARNKVLTSNAIGTIKIKDQTTYYYYDLDSNELKALVYTTTCLPNNEDAVSMYHSEYVVD